MKKIFGLLILCTILSCESGPVKKNSNTSLAKVSDSFIINGAFDSYFSEYVYLNKIMHNSLVKLDSSKIENNTFNFSGSVDYPERFALTFENSSAVVIFIVENVNFIMELDAKNPTEPNILNSPLNSELNHYKNHSKEIFREIDKLYPRFQKARLENDAETLDEIGSAMAEIETNYRNYSFNYVSKNPNSYISAMILRDLFKSENADIQKISTHYKLLSEEVKQIPDAQILAMELALTQKR